MNSCDACSRNEAIPGTVETPHGEGTFCRSCRAGCNRHWENNASCGCPIEIRCIDCDVVLATIKPGEPEPPLRCPECQAEEAA